MQSHASYLYSACLDSDIVVAKQTWLLLSKLIAATKLSG